MWIKDLGNFFKNLNKLFVLMSLTTLAFTAALLMNYNLSRQCGRGPSVENAFSLR